MHSYPRFYDRFGFFDLLDGSLVRWSRHIQTDRDPGEELRHTQEIASLSWSGMLKDFRRGAGVENWTFLLLSLSEGRLMDE